MERSTITPQGEGAENLAMREWMRQSDQNVMSLMGRILQSEAFYRIQHDALYDACKRLVEYIELTRPLDKGRAEVLAAKSALSAGGEG